MYITYDGAQVTKDQIKSAFDQNKAVLIHTHGDNRITRSLMLDGERFDTRGQDYSVWQNAWTSEPENIQACLSAAYIKPPLR